MINPYAQHLPGSCIPRRLRFAAVLLITAGTCLASPFAAHAERSISIQSPPQGVAIGGAPVGFEAQMEFCPIHHRGFGFVTFAVSEEEVVELYPFWGDVDRKTGAVVLFLSPRSDGPVGPGEIITLVVQDSAAEEDCDIYDLIGPGVIGGSALNQRFEAETRITRSTHRGNCAPRNYGQIDALVGIRVPAQRVGPLPPPSQITGFGTTLLLDRNQEAQGSLHVYTSTGRRTYEPLFGAAFRAGGAEVEFFVFSLLNSRRGFLSPDDHALRATGGITTIQPDCLIWDLVNGTTGQVNGLFNVEGTLRVRGAGRGR